MRKKGSELFDDNSDVAREVTRMLNASDKTQQEVAQELKLSKSNIMTMFKQGRTKVPLRLIAPLCRAMGESPRKLMELALNEYHPGLLDDLDNALGVARTTEEQDILRTIRDARRDGQMHLIELGDRARARRLKLDVSREKLHGLYKHVFDKMLSVD